MDVRMRANEGIVWEGSHEGKTGLENSRLRWSQGGGYEKDSLLENTREIVTC